VRFNCATLSGDLVEAELFGHQKGAFTGAGQARRGLFREAHGGTLLLDEIGELAPNAQAKLLRVLQEGEVRPVGADRPVTVDVRILASTHRDLRALVDAGAFREDLYYRLKVVQLTVPPLRDRPSDIEVLTRRFLERYRRRFGLADLHIPPGFMEALHAHDWPGNVRELENTLEMLVVLSDAGQLDLALLPTAQQPAPTGDLKARVAAYERGLIIQALQASGGNRSETARALGLGRATLYEKLNKHGLDS